MVGSRSFKPSLCFAPEAGERQKVNAHGLVKSKVLFFRAVKDINSYFEPLVTDTLK